MLFSNLTNPIKRFSLAIATGASLLMIFSLLLPKPSFAQGTAADTAMREFLNKPDSPVVLRGDYFSAVLSAYQDFAKRLKKSMCDSVVPKAESAESALRCFEINAYDIQVQQQGDTYLVHFAPTVRDQTHVVFGGGVTYTISRKDFKIVDKSISK